MVIYFKPIYQVDFEAGLVAFQKKPLNPKYRTHDIEMNWLGSSFLDLLHVATC